MTYSASFDPNTLAAVKPGMDGSLAEISAQLERYFAAPTGNAAALEAAHAETRRLSGVLKMVGLNGVAVFCAELEHVLGELAAHPQQTAEMHHEVLHRALAAVQHYLNALSRGAGNSALLLFPQYQELQQLRGIEMAFELDMFCPNLAVPLPQQVLSTATQGNSQANLKVLRSQYQQALLRWLRQEDAVGALQQMQQALAGVMHCMPQDDSRAFWWIACGLLDCLKLGGLPPELNARKLLGRIDQQIRTVAEGGSADVRRVLNEMLYLIGRSHATSSLMGQIKQLYALDEHLPELSALSPGETEQHLDSLRDQLRITEESWERAVQGDGAACEQFMKHAGQLVSRSEKLERNSLHYLSVQIQLLSEYASSPEHARLIAIDMAMALLLLGSGIENYRRLGNGFQEQARILAERMQAAIKQQPENVQQLSELVDLHYQMRQGEVMAPLAKEMLVNLQHIEQGLNAFFNGAIPHEELTGLQRLLNQILGGFRISSLDMAEQLLLSIQHEIADFTQGESMPKPVERNALADAMSALENYMQDLMHGRISDVPLLQKALTGIERAKLQPAAMESAPPTPPPAVVPQADLSLPALPQEVEVSALPPLLPVAETAPLPTDESQELTDIFLEEAQEVLGIMRGNLEICQLHPNSIDPLVIIRRGFHTLKGSGRMVGLTDLGEVAWSVERAMNKWLQDNKPATANLLTFISTAMQAFAAWVEVLRKQEVLHIEAGDLIAAAQQIESGLDTEPPSVVSAAVPKKQTEPEYAAEPEPASSVEPEPGPEAVPQATPESAPLSEFKFELEAMPQSELQPPASPAIELQTGHLPISIPDSDLEPQAMLGPASVEEPESAEEMVVIGDVMLSRALFNIASSEAVQNVAVLQEQLDALSAAEQPSVQYDFMRAAHTLVGLNRTMGFDVVVDLAYALENWLMAREDQPLVLGETQLHMLEEAVAALGEMILSICGQQVPQGRIDLANQLRADTENLGATSSGAVDIPIEEAPVEFGQIAHDVMHAAAKLSPAQNEKDSGGETTAESMAALAAALQAVAPTPVKMHAEVEIPQVTDDIDDQLLPVFLEESDELCPKIGEGLRAWREHPQDEQQPQLLKRLLHTMKGSSRMVGAMRIGEITHAMEDRISAPVAIREEAGYWDALDSDFDLVNALLEELRGGEVVVMPDKVAPIEIPEVRQAETGRRASDRQGDERKVDRRASDQSERAAFGSVLRVRSEVVDKLVNDAGEISVTRSRMEAELRTFKESLLELTASVTRLRHQLREVEIQAESQMQARVSLTKDNAEGFDPLEFDRFTRLQELTRFMNESVHDVQTVQRTLLKNLDEAAVVLLAQGRLSRELQQNLMNVRMVLFSSIADRLYRIVRQTCKELGKRANLELQGTGVELDRSVLEKMVAPFEHLLRNSIVHGMESDQIRAQVGKNPIGEIRLSVRQESNEVVFEFNDDGAGLNYAKLREKAVAKGLFQEGEPVSDEQLAQLIFTSGLSTASEITEVAGRGVGMDVVRSEITALGGTIDVKSKSGQGTQFTIRLPLTLAVTRILLVRSGETTYAVPSAMVEQVRQVKPDAMNALHSEKKIEWQDNIYPLHYLSQLLSDVEVSQENHLRNPVLLLRSGEQRIALHVDELLGNQEAVVKNIGPQLSRLSGIAGATVLGNGTVALILNPPQLAQRVGVGRVGRAIKIAPSVSAKPLSNLPLIMVVDDSLTVRKITSRLLTRAGYQVVTATDGIDALEQLQDFTPNVMLLDIEMPRMDGFALAKELRRNPKTRDLPIIMITSRTADKHRDYAMQLGVNTYLGKPYQEDELLQNIADFVAENKLDV